jgi:hypothetical protein
MLAGTSERQVPLHALGRWAHHDRWFMMNHHNFLAQPP